MKYIIYTLPKKYMDRFIRFTGWENLGTKVWLVVCGLVAYMLLRTEYEITTWGTLAWIGNKFQSSEPI